MRQAPEHISLTGAKKEQNKKKLRRDHLWAYAHKWKGMFGCKGTLGSVGASGVLAVLVNVLAFGTYANALALGTKEL